MENNNITEPEFEDVLSDIIELDNDSLIINNKMIVNYEEPSQQVNQVQSDSAGQSTRSTIINLSSGNDDNTTTNNSADDLMLNDYLTANSTELNGETARNEYFDVLQDVDVAAHASSLLIASNNDQQQEQQQQTLNEMEVTHESDNNVVRSVIFNLIETLEDDENINNNNENVDLLQNQNEYVIIVT